MDLPAGGSDTEICTWHPTLQQLSDKWTSQGIERREDYDMVEIGFSSWGVRSGDDYDGPPTAVVDWHEYAQRERPEILHDLLCNSLARIDAWGPPEPGDDGVVPDRGSRIGTSEAIATEAMTALANEHERQNGVPHEDCCHVFFAGYYWGAGTANYHVTFPD